MANLQWRRGCGADLVRRAKHHGGDEQHSALRLLGLRSRGSGAAISRAGRVGLLTPLRDGMNLVAKEYIAAQNPDDPGVLMLSRYAGAAEQMQAAVIVDPHQPTSMIEGLRTALTMPLKERQLRYQALLQGLHQDDLYAWQQRFLDDLYLASRYDNKKRSADDGAFDAIQMSDS